MKMTYKIKIYQQILTLCLIFTETSSLAQKQLLVIDAFQGRVFSSRTLEKTQRKAAISNGLWVLDGFSGGDCEVIVSNNCGIRKRVIIYQYISTLNALN